MSTLLFGDKELSSDREVSDQRLSNVVRISQRTVKRRLGEGRFHADESERLVRIARLTERANKAFEDLEGEGARDWLKSDEMNGMTPQLTIQFENAICHVSGRSDQSER